MDTSNEKNSDHQKFSVQENEKCLNDLKVELEKLRNQVHEHGLLLKNLQRI